MNDVLKIYENEIGLSFQWSYTNTFLTQVIFRDTGFHLTVQEIEFFLEQVSESRMKSACHTCQYRDSCRSLLLKTPSEKVSLAVSIKELNEIEDLLKGTLFQLNLNGYLNEVCKN